VHFEIHVDDLERAKQFYGAAFGWEFQDWSEAVGGTPYFGIMTGPAEEPGINGGMLQRPVTAQPSEHGTNAYICTMQVEDYDATERRILDAGGRVAMAKFAMAGMAWQGYYLDPEGNTFGVHQPDTDAR
jgi:predicted enzyme related to lactoylglutathione lyase